MAINIGSTGEWDRLVSSNTIVIADFYADWCGPCKMIAPAFSSLATKHTKPGRIAFAKVNVDNHQSISSRYGVRAMPTFKVLKSGSVIDTIQGANPPALTAAIEKAVKLAGPGAGAGFTGAGRTLGGTGVGGGSSWSGGSGRAAGTGAAGRSLGRSGGQRFSWSPNNIFMALRTFIGLYIVSLFSLDPYKAAERSTFNIHYRPPAHPAAGSTTGGRSGGAPRSTQAKPAFRTLADLGND